MNIQLFLYDTEIELDEKISFPITKSFEDLSNPTNIINDYSKNIEVPMTSANNRFFGHIYRDDKIETAVVGNFLNFNPHFKIPFRLLYNNELIMDGYAKMNSIDTSAKKRCYNLTLYGKIGEIFYDLQQCTFDHAESKYRYAEPFQPFAINAEAINTCWTSTDTGIDKWWNNVGFAVTNRGLYENFDSKSFSDGIGMNKTDIKDYLKQLFINSGRMTSDNEIPDNWIGEGLNEFAWSEFRSYLQQPYIKVKTIFETIKQKLQEWGYNLSLGSQWFNTSNPYWEELVYTLPHLKTYDVASGKGNNSFKVENAMRFVTINNQVQTNFFTYGYDVQFNQESVLVLDPNNSQRILITQNNVQAGRILAKIPFEMTAYVTDSSISTRETNKNIRLAFNINGARTIYTQFKIEGENLQTQTKSLQLLNYFPDSGMTKPIQTSNNAIVEYTSMNAENIDASNWYLVQRGYISFYIDFDQTLFSSNNYFTISLAFSSNNNNNVIVHFKREADNIFRPRQGTFTLNIGDCYIGAVEDNPNDRDFVFSAINFTNTNEGVRSNTTISIQDLWKSNITPFEALLNYCKMFGLLIRYFDNNKTLSITTKNSFFSQYTIEDWTNKVDTTNEYKVTPIITENRYMLFDYEKGESGLSKLYYDRYKDEYGIVKVDTGYNFSNDKKSVLKQGKPLIDSTVTAVTFSSLLDYNYMNTIKWTNFSFINPNGEECFFVDAENNNKSVNIQDTFSFVSRGTIKTSLTNRNFVISDDSFFEISNNQFTWNYNGISTNAINALQNNVTNNNKEISILYTEPNEIYKPVTDKSTVYIYPLCWQRYLEERYNNSNKKLSTYINMTYTDFKNFNFNTFVRIGNTLYMVNKIFDFDINANVPTKVELLTVSDIDAYQNAIDFSLL